MFELLVAVLVFSLVVAIASPSLSGTLDTFQKNSFLHHIIANLNESRAKALSEGARIIIKVEDSGDSYTVGLDNLPYSDEGDYDELINQVKLDSGNTLVAEDLIIFSSRGYLIDLNGEPTNIDLELFRHNQSFCSGSLYTVGAFEYDCSV